LPHISQTCAMTAPDGIRSLFVKHRFYRIWASSASASRSGLCNLLWY